MMAAHAETGGDSQPMTVTEGTGASSYGVDIRTEGGSWNHLTGVTLDSANSFGLSFSRLAPGVTNWVRIKPERVEGAVYSPAVRVVYNPDVTQDSSNQIQVISAGRSGTDVVLRWGLKNANGKKTRVYFRRADTGAVSLLTPQALNAGIKTLVLSNQALTIPCGEFLMSQLETGGPESPLSSPLFFVGIDLGIGHEVGCGGGYPDPPETPPVDLWSDYYHARDHLGNLRVVLEEAGAKVEAHDYYPFGQENLAQGKPYGTASRRKFTGHERDEETGWDNMNARFFSLSFARFLSVDPVYPDPTDPKTFNRFQYVDNNPIRYLDPTGKNGKDFHKDLVEVLAFAAGSSAEEAQMIGNFSNAMDNPASNATNPFHFISRSVYHFPSDWILGLHREKALGGEGGLVELGIYLHALGDSKSHSDFIGLDIHHKGLLFGWVGDPDETASNPAKATQAALEIFLATKEFNQQRGIKASAQWNEIQGWVKQFCMAKTESEKKGILKNLFRFILLKRKLQAGPQAWVLQVSDPQTHKDLEEKDPSGP